MISDKRVGLSPEISFFFTSAYGDIPVRDEDMSKPLVLNMASSHATVSFGDYLHALAKFIIQDECRILKQIVEADDDSPVDNIVIRSEKLGAFYNIASIAFSCSSKDFKVAASSACTEHGKQCLKKDFEIVNRLNSLYGERYLPVHYHLEDDIPIQCNDSSTFSTVLSEWLEGYHEWHFSTDNNNREGCIVVWDNDNGHFVLDRRREEELFRQIAFIHTLYYDLDRGEQICQWHHSAGDFIVGHVDSDLKVKLTTIRRYERFSPFHSDAPTILLLACFLLDLSVRIRIDRLDGTGEPYVAEKRFLKPMAQGFLDALDMKSTTLPFSLEDFLGFMRSLTLQEMENIFHPLTMLYQNEDEINMPFLSTGFSRHLEDLMDVLHRHS